MGKLKKKINDFLKRRNISEVVVESDYVSVESVESKC